MKPEIVLWLYLVVLIAGGIYGYIRARSTISLVSSLVFAALLAVAALGLFRWMYAGDVLLTILVIVFAKRFQKTRKFMPAGLMTIVTIAALLVRAMMLWG